MTCVNGIFIRDDGNRAGAVGRFVKCKFARASRQTLPDSGEPARIDVRTNRVTVEILAWK